MLSGSHSLSTVNPASLYEAERLTLKGDKLIVTDYDNSLIFEHDLKTGLEIIVAGGLKDASGDYIRGYENAENSLQAKLNSPLSIATSPKGNIYFTVRGVTGIGHKIIRKLAASNGVYGAVTTAFGATPDSTADTTELSYIYDILFIDNNLYVLEEDDDGIISIKKIEFSQAP